MQSSYHTSSKHQVFIVNNDGMNLLYPKILSILRNEQDTDSHLTVLYISATADFTFEEELSILGAHYPQRLVILYKTNYQMPYLESIINANTKKHLSFQVSLDIENQTTIVDQLRFLGISFDCISISNQQFNNQ